MVVDFPKRIFVHNKKIKVAHVTFDMRVGGAERVILDLVQNTEPSRYAVSVICLQRPLGPFAEKLRSSGCHIETFNRKPGFDLSLIRGIRNVIQKNNINILHCHQYSPFVYGVLAAAFTSCRVIFTEHGRFYPDRRKIKRVIINPALFRLTSRVTAISEATRRALKVYENFPMDKIEVIYNGIDDTHIRMGDCNGLKAALGIDAKAPLLGTVARLDPIKNHPMMIRALKQVHKSLPEATLLVVGDGPEMPKLKKLVDELEVSNRVVFTGMRSDARRFYQIMDVFLLTSFSEGTAMTLLEAMASGVPSLVTDVGGNPEIVSDGETGFIVPSEDSNALAGSILNILGKHSIRETMGRAARKRFEERFSVHKMVLEYQKLYESCHPG
jgi:glycosyltransferase involved in cell wall biosynthesis